MDKVLILLFGLAFGSFQNVLISRIPRGESIFGRSYCETCNHRIGISDNIPVISFLILKGHCRHCGARISIRHLLIELLCPLMLLLGSYAANTAFDALIWGIFTLFAIPLLVIDQSHHRLPNVLNYSLFSTLFFLIFAKTMIDRNYHLFLTSIFQAFSLFCFYLIIRLLSKGGMGLGDAKLSLSIGLLSGYYGNRMLFISTYGAFLLGALYSIAILIFKKSGRKTKVPFGPFMILGMYLALFINLKLHPNSNFFGNL